MKKSIRRDLLLWQILALVITCAVVCALTYHMAWTAFNRVRDFGMEQIAHSVVRHGVRPHSWASDTPAHAAPLATARPTPSENPPAWATDDLGVFISQIWTLSGERLYASVDSGGPPLQTPGFHDIEWAGDHWRVFTLRDDEELVQVAKNARDRASTFSQMALWLFALAALVVLVLGMLIHAAVTRALAPLNALGRDIRQRDAKELQPITIEGMPDELVPLGNSLNRLLARVDGLLTQQRQMLADAAHELNTPLAAVKLQAQLARRAPSDQREAALDELDRGIARSTHLVAQLLQMARLDAQARRHEPAAMRLDRLAAEVVAAFSAQAEARDIDLGLDTCDAASVWADPLDMRVLLDNLVDNALRHTPAGSRVDVRVEASAARVDLVVNDNGPGISPADRPRVLERFVRLNPHDDASGSGLGLAIVTRIAQRNEGLLTLASSPSGGLSVRVGFNAHT
ncbi:ATP-binding protein [Hydrogenophaga sp. BPS33]|uniref:ATP-binding protein n=1 Tax=Hydrogenophaga sp. BPS33 TaxID=2651974 RepID=UPI00131FAA84|nr:ATP-binding protein [Hydrogenophaga sp. BPS33]QHE85248.1 two-component sensor histidine kinase [Hydrogenophaga sp. BPS33]